MGLSPRVRSGETASHMFIIFVTLAQMIFFTWFHKYISWYTSGLDGSIIRSSMLTAAYFNWLPIMITGSIIVILVSIAMVIFNNYKFKKAGEISFNVIGFIITVSLVSIFPFDFSSIPNSTAINIVPIAVRVFFILLPVFYGVTGLIMFLKLRKQVAKQDRD